MSDKVALLEEWSRRLLWRPGPVAHVDRPAARGEWRTSTTPTRPAPSPPAPGRASGRSSRPSRSTPRPAPSRPCAPSPRPSAGAGSTSPGRVGLGRASSPPCPSSWPRRCGAVGRGRPLRPRHRPDQPVADHPRVDRPRHRARPRARLRGGLRRHVVRDLRPARLAPLRVRCHERHRRPHGAARPGHRRLRRRGGRARSLRHHPRRRARRLPARPAAWRPRRGSAGPTGAPSPTRPLHMPLQRMANVSLQPGARPGRRAPRTSSRASSGGIYVVGDKSWSIDMQRYNFQFTGQRFFRIEDGRLAGRSTTSPTRPRRPSSGDRWRRSAGESTYVLGGAFNCGKGQPGRSPPVSHGCPPALFRAVRVLNARPDAAVSPMRPGEPGRATPRGDRRARARRQPGRRVRRDRGGAEPGRGPFRHQLDHHQRRPARATGDGRELRRPGRPGAGGGAGGGRGAAPARSTSRSWSGRASPRRRGRPRRGAAPLVAPGQAWRRRGAGRADADADFDDAPARHHAVLAAVVSAWRRPSPGPDRPATASRVRHSRGGDDLPRHEHRPPRRHAQPTGTLELGAPAARRRPARRGRAPDGLRWRRRRGRLRGRSRASSGVGATPGRAARRALRGDPPPRSPSPT